MKVLAVSVHPDDETLGCGGTLLKHSAAGESLHWLIVTSLGEEEHTHEQRVCQEACVQAVREAYPFATLDWLRFPTTRLDTLPLNTIVAAIREVIARVRPQTLFVPNRSDVHSDHRVVFAATAAVMKSFYMQSFGVERILACEVPSETDAAAPLPEHAFLPTVYVDISGTIDRKLEIMSLYGAEMHPEPLPRSGSAIRALARHRGASIGAEYAEAFMLIRECCW